MKFVMVARSPLGYLVGAVIGAFVLINCFRTSESRAENQVLRRAPIVPSSDASATGRDEHSEKTLLLEVEMRKAEVDLLSRKLEQSLNDRAIARLNELEDELGLNYDHRIARNTPIAELTYRLATIEALRIKQHDS